MSSSSEAGLMFSTIGMLIVGARKSIRQLIAAKLVPLDITPHHYWMIMTLFMGEPMSLGELAKAMWMDSPTVSRLVQQMVLRGYLTVGADPSHRRRISIGMTQKGLTLCEKFAEIRGHFQEKSQRGMTPMEVAALREGLCYYIRNLDEMVASELPGMSIRPKHHWRPVEEKSLISGI